MYYDFPIEQLARSKNAFSDAKTARCASTSSRSGRMETNVETILAATDLSRPAFAADRQHLSVQARQGPRGPLCG